MTVENDEWRIDKAPNAMIVSDSWFASRYRQVSLYFFDPTGQILVPEPVFVPSGRQFATSLMRGLLRGPGTRLSGVSRTFIPKGLTLDLSVPVSADGLAEVTLQGDVSGLDPETIELMTVQIAWTLRQDPSVERVRVNVGDTPITIAGRGARLRRRDRPGLRPQRRLLGAGPLRAAQPPDGDLGQRSRGAGRRPVRPERLQASATSR